MQFLIARCSDRQKRRRRMVPVAALLALSMLVVQSADLAHSHGGDLQAQFECEICLQAGSTDDVTSVANAQLTFGTVRQSYLVTDLTPRFLAVPTASSRSPPSI